MKKYGLLVTVCLLLISNAVYAGGNMVGKMIDSQYPLWLHGNRLDKDAVVINGVSYVPVRVVSKALGLNVEFKDNQVFLKSPVYEELPRYKVMSNALKLTDAGQVAEYYIKDGEWYYPIVVFSTNDGGPSRVEYDLKENKVTFNMPWGKIALTRSDVYSPGVPFYTENNRSLVSLTALGLKPVIRGDEVWLEKI